MRVLLATPLYSSRHLDSGAFWLKALHELGHSVFVWDYRLTHIPPSGTFDLTLVLKGGEIDPEMLRRPRVVYWPDALQRTPGIDAFLQRFDRVYTCLRPTPTGMVWLPTGYDRDMHRHFDHLRVLDTVFIGTRTDYKARMLDLATNNVLYNSAIWGNGWTPVNGGGSVRGEAIYSGDYVTALNSATISLNVHRDPGIGLNRRLFESIACNFTITDLVPGVTEVLGDDLALKVGFTTAEQARATVDYYLRHPKEREDLWQQERKAIGPYSYKSAAEKILSFV